MECLARALQDLQGRFCDWIDTNKACANFAPSRKPRVVFMTTIGIDLGTSNSSAAILRGGRPVMIPSSEGFSLGGKAFPSFVALTPDGELLVGEPARRQATANPEGTTTAFKRRMGQRIKLRLRQREFTPEELSALLLQKIKRDAESYLGESIRQAVVTVPAYFDDNQRTATRDAARIAGLEVSRLVNEPTAAALAYGIDRLQQDLRILVVDFGGGTLDVTVMEFGKGVFEVKATSGDTQLGGSDMNQRVFASLADRFKLSTGFDVRSDLKAAARLLEAAETAKIELSSLTSVRINLPFIAQVHGKTLDFDLELTRSELERIVHPVIEQCRQPIERALSDAKLDISKIDRLLFVGGPTRMPVVRGFFEDILGRKAEMGVDPMECVAAGAAIQGAVLEGGISDIVLVDVTPLTLGVETLGGIATPMISRNTPIPVKKTEVFTTAADMQTAVTVQIFQGERPIARDNTQLGTFNLEGLAPAPRGVPKIDVSFEIDASGILDVSAKDTVTGAQRSIRITGSTRLSEAEKSHLIDEASRYAEDDKRRRDVADKLNAADSICYQGERFLADFGSKISSDDRARIELHIRDLKKSITDKNVDSATAHSEALKKTLQETGSRIYAPTVGPTPAPTTEKSQPGVERPHQDHNPQPPPGRVVNAEYRKEQP